MGPEFDFDVAHAFRLDSLSVGNRDTHIIYRPQVHEDDLIRSHMVGTARVQRPGAGLDAFRGDNGHPGFLERVL